MSASSGPRVVTSGLILDLDFSNRKSFLRATQTNILSTEQWIDGQTDGTSYYYANGQTGENARVLDSDPWGNTSVVWETRASGNGNDDGGWNTEFFSIDKQKLYRFSVWVRRTSTSASGTFYLGTNSNVGVYQTVDGVERGNPYWECSGTNTLDQNQWYLVCGFVYPYDTLHVGNHPDSGYYLPRSKTKVRNVSYCNITSDLKWGQNSTLAQHRCYHYYCGDSTTRLQFFDPRIELCDGNEPSIEELVNMSSNQIKDLSSYHNDHHISNGYMQYLTNPNRFSMNGQTHGIYRNSSLNGVTSDCTVVIYYKTTDYLELWVRGNSDNSMYLSASDGGNYYHGSNVGYPQNYVDLSPTIRPTMPINYRNGEYHMWEAKNVNFSSWSSFEWFQYPSGWQLIGDVQKILVYNRVLSAEEQRINYIGLKPRFGL